MLFHHDDDDHDDDVINDEEEDYDDDEDEAYDDDYNDDNHINAKTIEDPMLVTKTMKKTMYDLHCFHSPHRLYCPHQ